MRAFIQWLRRLQGRPLRHAPARAKRARAQCRPWLEELEARVVPDSGGAANIYQGAHLGYGGGPLIANVQVQPIFIKDSTSGNQTSAANRTSFDSFFSTITSDGFISTQLSQYSAGRFTIGNGGVGPDDTGANVAPDAAVGSTQAYDDALIQTIITNEIAANRTAAATANTVYFVFIPPGDAAIDAAGLNSQRDFMGYHSTFTSNGQAIYYAVLPDEISTPANGNLHAFGFSGFQGMTQTASHELAEAITDPDCATGWMETAPAFVDLDGGEVADHAGNSANYLDGYSVQSLWSNPLTDISHAPGTGANDLFINQIAAPAVNTFTSGPIATFTDLNTNLTAADFFADVSDNNGAWTEVKITGGNGRFVISANPPEALTDGEVGSPFAGDGLQVIVSTSPIDFDNPSGAPIALKGTPYVVSNTAPLTYIADSGSGTNNFVLKEVGANFQLTDNDLLVFTQPIAQTTGINIGAAATVPGNAGANVNDSLTIDFSGGMFDNAVTFDGGPGAGAHSLTFKGGSFANESYTPTNATSGTIVLGNQSIAFQNVGAAVNLTTATNFVINGTNAADQLKLSNGPVISGVGTIQLTSATGTLGNVDFANQATVTVQEAAGLNTFLLTCSRAAAGLTTLNLNGGVTAGVLFAILETPTGLTTNVLGAGSAVTVNLGYTGLVQSILGAVNVDNSGGANNAITVDDSADATSQTVTLSSTAIQGLAPADISFTAAGTASLTIKGGAGANRFAVNSAGLFPTILNTGAGSDVVTVDPLVVGASLTVNGPLPAQPADTLFYTGTGIDNPSGPSAGTITQADQGTVTYAGIETLRIDPPYIVNAIWVNSDEITDPGARANLVNQCVINGINTIYLSVYQSTPNSAGRLMYDEADMAALISSAHAHDIKVWADYGAPDWPALGAAAGSFPMQRLDEVVAYNAANPAATFDGVMLDVEFAYDSSNPANYDNQEHAFLQQLLPLDQEALNVLEPAGVQVGATISAFWNPSEVANPADDQAAVTITFNSVTAPAYQQIIGLGLNQVVVLGYRDFAGTIPPSEGEDGIIGLDQDEINFAVSSGSSTIIVAGLETQNIGPGNQTFFGAGDAAMNGVMQTVAGYFGTNLGGFAIDGYGSAYLSGQTNWPSSSQIAPTVTWPTPADITYGTTLSGTQLDATASTAGTFTYTLADGAILTAGAELPAGQGQTLDVTFTPSNAVDFAPAMSSVVINVSKATPILSWSNPADITYGTPLSGAQLDATASTAGTFNYTLADGTILTDGTVLPAGQGQTLNVAFVPTDTADFNAAADSVAINVAMATPIITWSNPADITYGTALGASQLNATANVGGTFRYTLADGTTPASNVILSAGPSQALSVTFQPTDTTDYTAAAGSVVINVGQASQTIELPILDPAPYAATPITLPANGGLSGNLVTITVVSGPGSIAGNVLTFTGIGTIVFDLNQAGNANFTAAPTVERSVLVTAAYQETASEFADTPTTVNVANLLGGNYSDVGRATTTPGIAVIQTGGSGTWQYTNGTTWAALGAVTPTHALLLSGNESLRFMPATDSSAQATLDFVAWDGAQGKAGSIADTVPGGGTTPFSTSAGALAVTVNPVPAWVGAGAALPSALPGTNAPSGVSVNSIFGSFFQDPNAHAAFGIAVVGVAGNGAWQFSTDNISWSTFTQAPSKSAALLLPGNDFIRFVPNRTFVGTATLTAYAWDGSGTHSSPVNLAKTGVGAATGFSATTLTATAAVNHAPTVAGTPITGTLVATNATGAASTVSSLLTKAGYLDPDGKNLPQGIAVTNTNSSAGAFQYMLAGGSWQALPNVSTAAALLLPSSASLRLVANGQPGTATLTFQGWDQTQGAAGPTFAIASSGAATAFSSNSCMLSIAVDQAAPSWNAASGPALPALAPGVFSTSNSTPAGASVATVFGSFFQNSQPNFGIAVVGVSGSGTWQYMLSGASSWSNFSLTSSATAALLLSGNDLIRFVPKSNTATVGKLSAYAWDGVGTHGTSVNLKQQGVGGVTNFSATTLTATSAVNNAPTLNAFDLNVSLPSVGENVSSPSITAAALLSKAGHQDPDSNFLPAGIAITGAAGHGTWQWLNGATWTAVPSVSTNLAFLLPGAAQVRFMPADNLPINGNGSATLTYLAWDETAGSTASLFPIASRGGVSAFSTAAASATMAINFVKQAPAWAPAVSAVFTAIPGFSIFNPQPNPAGDTVASVFGAAFFDAPGVSAGIAITALGGTSVGAWQFSVDGGTTWTPLPAVSTANALLLQANAKLRFVPDEIFSGVVTLTAYAWDGTGTFTTINGASTVNLTKTATGGATPFSATTLTATCLVNNAPMLA